MVYILKNKWIVVVFPTYLYINFISTIFKISVLPNKNHGFAPSSSGLRWILVLISLIRTFTVKNVLNKKIFRVFKRHSHLWVRSSQTALDYIQHQFQYFKRKESCTSVIAEHGMMFTNVCVFVCVCVRVGEREVVL